VLLAGSPGGVLGCAGVLLAGSKAVVCLGGLGVLTAGSLAVVTS
jgi:hypothetical protein